MLVVHPKDKTTSVPSALYEGKDANVISGNCSKKEMEHLLHHVSTQERIMLLGHGANKGLYIIIYTFARSICKRERSPPPHAY